MTDTMTPTEQAARWLADLPRWQAAEHELDGPFMETAPDGEYFFRPHVIAAIARHLAPGDELAAQASAALEGVSPGPWRADGEPWNQIVWSGAENRVCFMAHSNGLDDDRDIATARFIAFARQWVPEAAARIAALTATVAELEATVAAVTSDRAYIIGANAGWEASVEQGQATPAAQAVLGRIKEAEDRIAAVANAAEADSARLRAILATIVSRCDTAKQQCNDGEPVSAFNLASAILGQIGSYRATLQPSEKPE